MWKFNLNKNESTFQDTWMSVTKKVTGRKMVEKYIDQTVGYYIKWVNFKRVEIFSGIVDKV